MTELPLPPQPRKRASVSEFRRAILQVRRLYSTPQILSRALRLIRQPHTSVDEITDLVRRDPALTADFLHLSNSALFRRGSFCTHLAEAVQRLGLNELLRLLSLSLSKNVFGKDLANYGITAGQYWTESVWSALFVESLALAHGVDAEDAYLVGLLHQLGRVLINEALLDLGWSLFWDGREPIETWEADHVGFTNAEAAALLLKEWEFPDPIVEAIALSSRPAPDHPDSGHSLASLLQFSRLCLSAADPANLHRGPLPSIPDDVFPASGLASPQVLMNLIEAATTSVDSIRRTFNAP